MRRARQPPTVDLPHPGIPTSATQLYNFAAVQRHSDNTQNQTNNLNISGSIEFGFDWIKALKGLSAKVSYSKSISNSKNNTVQTIQDVYRMLSRTGSGGHLYTGDNAVYDNSNMGVLRLVSNGGLLSRTMSRNDSYQYNITLQYARQFGLHDVSGLFTLEKTEAFFELLLEANTESLGMQAMAFGKLPDSSNLILQWRIPTQNLTLDAFCAELEAFINKVEQWRQALEDFRPAAEKAVIIDEESQLIGMPNSGFISV